MLDKQYLQPVKGKRIEAAFLQPTGEVMETDKMLMGDGVNEISDEHLTNATLAGDDEAFALLVGRYKRRVFSLVN